MAELIGPYGEGTLSFISPNCVHLLVPKPSSQAAVTQPAAPCPSSTPSQEPWAHIHSSFLSSVTLCRIHSRERQTERGGKGAGIVIDGGLKSWSGFLEHETLSSCWERKGRECQGHLPCSGNPLGPFHIPNLIYSL